ncbi:MAG: AAA family ATPase, partial [Solirubrobacteraceae bacterium]
MLSTLRVSNFKSLGESVDLSPGELTALVGPNGSGKSNLVDVIRFVADALRDGLDSAIVARGGIRAVGRWSGGRPFDVAVEIDIEDGDQRGKYAIKLKSRNWGEDYQVVYERASWDGAETTHFSVDKGRWRGPDGLAPNIDDTSLVLPLAAADRRFRPLYERLRSAAVYAIFPDVLRSPQKHDPGTPMDEHGTNWATTLRDVLKHADRRAELLVALSRVVGDIDDVDVQSTGGFLIPRFRHALATETRRNKWFDAAQESDGTLRVAGILTALLQDPAPAILGVEEPELTIHPGALPLIYDYLVQAGERSQILVTTHSPDLLDLLDPSCIYSVERDEGVTKVRPMSSQQLHLIRE